MLVAVLAAWLAAPSAAASPGYLTERQVAEVRRLMPTYERAARLAGVPRLALPAIHYREADLLMGSWSKRRRAVIRNLGGPFMMDMGGEGWYQGSPFYLRVRAEEGRVAETFSISPAPRVSDDFDFAALCAAVHLRDKAREPLWTNRGTVDLAALADALWGYHGRALYHRDVFGRHSWRGSPYVSNHPLRGRRYPIRVEVRGGVSEYLDGRPGALVLYQEMTRTFGEDRP